MATALDTANIVISKSAGAKAGNLAAYNPSAQNLVEFDVTRAAATATRVNSAGLIESVAANVPRIDWSEGLACPSLLVEPQRTNLLTRSIPDAGTPTGWSLFTSGTGTPSSTLVTSGLIEGTNNALRFQQTTANRVFIFNTWSAVAGTEYQLSIYVDLDNSTTTDTNAVIAQATGISTTGIDDIKYSDVDPATGRAVVTFTSNDTNAAANIRIGPGSSAGLYDADIIVTGWQIEAGAYVSSLIVSAGSTETRNADVIEKTSIASLLGDSEGSVFFEASVFDNSVSNRINLSDGSTSNRFTFALSSNITNFTIVGGVAEASPSGGTISNNTYTKIAGRYSVNDFALYQDGSSVATDTSGSTFSDGTLTDIYFANGTGGGLFFYGRIRSLAVYDIALTNTELQNITT